MNNYNEINHSNNQFKETMYDSSQLINEEIDNMEIDSESGTLNENSNFEENINNKKEFRKENRNESISSFKDDFNSEIDKQNDDFKEKDDYKSKETNIGLKVNLSTQKIKRISPRTNYQENPSENLYEEQFDFFFSIDPFISKIYDLCSLLDSEFEDDSKSDNKSELGNDDNFDDAYDALLYDNMNEDEEYYALSSSDFSSWIPSNNKRIRTLYELYETEKDYVKNLYILRDEYASALKEVLSKEAHEFIFRHLETIISVCEPFYNKLKDIIDKRHSNDEDILGFMDIVMEAVPTWKVYADYINHYEDIIEYSKKEKDQNPAFAKAETDINQKIKSMGYRSTTLRSYSVQPVQRIPRIRLLLNDILRRTDKEHPEYDKIVLALDCVSELASYCNEKKKEMENKRMLNSLQKKLGLKSTEDRKYMREVEVKIDSKPYTMYLFNDTIILSQKGEKRSLQIPLNDALVRFCSIEEDNRIMRIEMKRVEMNIQMASSLLKDSWLDTIHKQQQLLVKGNEIEERKIYEGWLKKQGGEVKTLKRRYHVLTNQRMKYHEKRGGKLKGSYNVSNAIVGIWTKKANGFYIQTGERSFCNIATSEEERQIWIDSLLTIPGIELGPPSSLQEKKKEK